jgi:hypothetical protein
MRFFLGKLFSYLPYTLRRFKTNVPLNKKISRPLEKLLALTQSIRTLETLTP